MSWDEYDQIALLWFAHASLDITALGCCSLGMHASGISQCISSCFSTCTCIRKSHTRSVVSLSCAFRATSPFVNAYVLHLMVRPLVVETSVYDRHLCILRLLARVAAAGDVPDDATLAACHHDAASKRAELELDCSDRLGSSEGGYQDCYSILATLQIECRVSHVCRAASIDRARSTSLLSPATNTSESVFLDGPSHRLPHPVRRLHEAVLPNQRLQH